MSATITLLYPNDPKENFDLDYYLGTHMPLVAKTWKPFGLKSYQVIRFAPEAEGSEPPYRIGVWFVWESIEGARKAIAAPESKPVFADVANYSSNAPKLVFGDFIGGWTAEN